jgi:hypothetical protein
MNEEKPARRAPKVPKAPKEPKTPKDIAIFSGPTEDGQGARVLRIREGVGVSAGEIRPLREGEPINHSELVRLHPLDENKRVCAVEVLHAPKTSDQPADDRKSAGPARVSNEKYRQNWSVIFGSSDANSDGDWSVN